jgi:hypothetical protein
MKIHTDPKCVFNYCPNPDSCKLERKCRHPHEREEKKQ